MLTQIIIHHLHFIFVFPYVQTSFIAHLPTVQLTISKLIAFTSLSLGKLPTKLYHINIGSLRSLRTHHYHLSRAAAQKHFECQKKTNKFLLSGLGHPDEKSEFLLQIITRTIFRATLLAIVFFFVVHKQSDYI